MGNGEKQQGCGSGVWASVEMVGMSQPWQSDGWGPNRRYSLFTLAEA